MPLRSLSGGYEKASRLGHSPIVNSEFVKDRLQNKYRVYDETTVGSVPDEIRLDASEFDVPQENPPYAISIDGSSLEQSINEKYPSNSVGYIQVAGVLVKLTDLAVEQENLFVDPAVIEQAILPGIMPIVMSSSNICRNDMDSVRDSWRIDIYELFREYEVENIPIFDTFLKVLIAGGRISQNNNALLSKCSGSVDCTNVEIGVPAEGGVCDVCGSRLFPTDMLRIHEEVQEMSSNQTALNRLMTTLEQITMLSYIDYLYTRRPQVLADVAFILDGPLAMFGPPAPYKRAIQAYLENLGMDLASRGFGLPILFGMEKTGQFADHAKAISEYLDNQTLMRLPENYVVERIVTTNNYGSNYTTPKVG